MFHGPHCGFSFLYRDGCAGRVASSVSLTRQAVRSSRGLKPVAQPLLLEEHPSPMPTAPDLVELHLRHGLCVKVAPAETGSPTSGLDEALTVAAEGRWPAFPRDRADDVPCHDLGLAVGEHTGLGQGLPELERDSGHISDGVDAV